MGDEWMGGEVRIEQSRFRNGDARWLEEMGAVRLYESSDLFGACASPFYRISGTSPGGCGWTAEFRILSDGECQAFVNLDVEGAQVLIQENASTARKALAAAVRRLRDAVSEVDEASRSVRRYFAAAKAGARLTEEKK